MKTLLHWLLVAAALGYTAYQAPPLVRSAGAEAGRLGEVRWGWVAVAVLLGLAAVALYAELHRELLAVGGAHPPAGTVQSITFAQNAIANTVPVVGGAGALAYAISRFRRRGVDPALASWAVLLAGLLTTLCLIVLAAVALAATGRLPAAAAVAAAVLVAAVAVGGWALVTHPAVLRGLAHRLLRLSRYVPGQCRTCRDERAARLELLSDRAATRVALLRPSPPRWLVLLVVAVLTWVVDFADLAASAAAVSGTVPWSALIWGFLIVQASIALQVLPGGAGLAEVGLLGALVAAPGVGAGPAAAIVLIYRASSWLLPSVAGWVTYGVQIHLIRPRPHRHDAAPHPDDVPPPRDHRGGLPQRRPGFAPGAG